jgi:hypothetical protein
MSLRGGQVQSSRQRRTCTATRVGKAAYWVYSPHMSCGICGHPIDNDLSRRETGDFHGKCFTSLKASGLHLKTATGEEPACLLCSQHVEKGAIAVELIDTAFTHLRCFFGRPNGHTRSLGACAASLSLTRRGQVLRDQSDALIGHSHLLIARLRAHYLN